MTRRWIVLGTLAWALAASAAHADDVDFSPRFSNGLGFFGFYQDVTVPRPLGFAGSQLTVTNGSVLGGGFDVRHWFNHGSGRGHWFGDLQGGYAFGNSKDIFGVTTTNTSKVAIHDWVGKAGAGYSVWLTNKAYLYGEGGAFYSNTWGDFSTTAGPSFPSGTGKPWKTWGVDEAFGGGVNLTPRINLFGETYSESGWGEAKDGISEHHETVKYGCYRGGLMRLF